MNVRNLVVKASSPIATVYACPFCLKFHTRVPKGQRGAGRGFGLATSSIASASVVAHIRSAHPEKLKA